MTSTVFRFQRYSPRSHSALCLRGRCAKSEPATVFWAGVLRPGCAFACLPCANFLPVGIRNASWGSSLCNCLPFVIRQVGPSGGGTTRVRQIPCRGRSPEWRKRFTRSTYVARIPTLCDKFTQFCVIVNSSLAGKERGPRLVVQPRASSESGRCHFMPPRKSGQEAATRFFGRPSGIASTSPWTTTWRTWPAWVRRNRGSTRKRGESIAGPFDHSAAAFRRAHAQGRAPLLQPRKSLMYFKRTQENPARHGAGPVSRYGGLA